MTYKNKNFLLKLLFNLRFYKFKHPDYIPLDKILKISRQFPTDFTPTKAENIVNVIPPNFKLPQLKSHLSKAAQKTKSLNKKNNLIRMQEINNARYLPENFFDVGFVTNRISIFRYDDYLHKNYFHTTENIDLSSDRMLKNKYSLISWNISKAKNDNTKKLFIPNRIFNFSKKQYFIPLKINIFNTIKNSNYSNSFIIKDFFDFFRFEIEYLKYCYSPFNLKKKIYDDVYMENIKVLSDQKRYKELNPIKISKIIKNWKYNYTFFKKKKKFSSFDDIFYRIFQFLTTIIKGKNFINFIKIKKNNFILKILKFEFNEKYFFIDKVKKNFSHEIIINENTNKIKEINLKDYKEFFFYEYIKTNYFKKISNLSLNYSFVWEYDYIYSFKYTEIMLENFDCLSCCYVIIYDYWEDDYFIN